MSDETTEPDAETPKKKGKGLIGKLIIGLVLIGAGGGGVFGAMQAGLLGGEAHAEEKTDHSPKLIRKGEEDPYAPPLESGEDGVASVPGEGGSKYRTAYYSFDDDFTSNLRGSIGLIQLSLAASTKRDGRVLMWLKEHELAVRSAILVVLADTPEEDVLSPEGKVRLQKRIAAAINKVLTEAEGFGGIDAVYFRSLLVQ